MNVREFIEVLKCINPEQDAEVCIDNHPVRGAICIPWHFDGKLEYIQKDNNFYPIKAGYKLGGKKVSIGYDTLENAFEDNPNIELEISGAAKDDIIYLNSLKAHADNLKEWYKLFVEFLNKKGTTVADFPELGSLRYKIYKLYRKIKK